MTEKLGVSAPDAYTLVIELEYENPFFTELLTSAAAMPCNEKFFYEQKGKYGVSAELTAFNGPFTVTTWDPQTYVVMRTNEGYASERPSVSGGLTLYICENASESTQRLLDGTTDFAPLTYEEKEELYEKVGVASFEDTVWSLTFNPQSEYFKNKNIRKGIAYTIDSSLFEEKVWENYKPAFSIVPPAVTIGESSYRSLTEGVVSSAFNPENAKICYEKGLEELEITRLRNVNMIIPEHSDFPILAGMLQEQWEKYLGVYINIEPLKNDELYARLSSGDYDMAILPMQSSYNSPMSILDNIASEHFLWSAEELNSYKAMLKDAMLSTSSESAVQKFAAAEQMINDNAVIVPLLFETSYYGIGKDVEDLIMSPFAYRAFVKYARKPS